MEEKKLTDEEIIKELINESNRGEWCELSFIDCVEVRVLKNAIDLIRRLQSENEALNKGVKRLKRNYEKAIKQNADDCVKKFCETIMYVEQERLVKENAELQKQVDELTVRLDYFQKSSDYHEGNQKELEIRNAELQKQVEAWKAKARELEQAWEISSTNEVNLQKQVDELKAEKEVSIKAIEDRLAEYYFMGCSYGAIVSGKMSISIAEERAKEYAPILYDFVKQAVKDKAKEIFENVFEVLCCFTTQGKSKEYNEGYIDCLAEVDKRLQNLAKEKHGVEVE